MEVGSYPLSPEDKAFGFKLSTEKSIDIKYFTLTLIIYNKVYWMEIEKKEK